MSTNDQALVLEKSVDLLSKTVDYLRRLPRVPETTRLVEEIERHLRSPEAIIEQARLDALKSLEVVRYGTVVTAEGIVKYEVSVGKESVIIRTPHYPYAYFRRMKGDNRLHELAAGVVVPLQQA